VFPLYPGPPEKLLSMKNRLRLMRNQLTHCIGSVAHVYVGFEDIHNFLHVDKGFDLVVSEFKELRVSWATAVLREIRANAPVMTDEVEGFLERMESELIGENGVDSDGNASIVDAELEEAKAKGFPSSGRGGAL